MYITVSNTYLLLASGTRDHGHFSSSKILVLFSVAALLGYLACDITIGY
jgi:hypothetical protein